MSLCHPDAATPATAIPGLVPETHRATIFGTSDLAPWVPARNAGMTPVGGHVIDRTGAPTPIIVILGLVPRTHLSAGTTRPTVRPCHSPDIGVKVCCTMGPRPKAEDDTDCGKFARVRP